MKNATKYQKKIRRLLSKIDKSPKEPPDEADPIRLLVESVVRADAAPKQVEKALAALGQEFVDVNELRVSPPKEIVDALGRDYPYARQKALELTTVLNGLFARHNALTFGDMEKLPKRDVRRHLTELGVAPYAAGCLMLFHFKGHAIPVDRTLVECLEMARCVEPGSSPEQVQGLLERTILQKHAVTAHGFFRDYIATFARALARKRKADAEAAARAAAKAEAAAEAAAKAPPGKAKAPARKKKAGQKTVQKARKPAKKAPKRSAGSAE